MTGRYYAKLGILSTIKDEDEDDEEGKGKSMKRIGSEENSEEESDDDDDDFGGSKKGKSKKGSAKVEIDEFLKVITLLQNK